MSRSAKYFSWTNKVKFCNSCKAVLPLSQFSESTNSSSPEKAGYYRYICKKCNSNVSKARQRLTYKSRRT